MSTVKTDSVIGSFLPIPVIEHATDYELFTATVGQTVFTTTKFDRSNAIRVIARGSGGAFTEVTASWTGANTVTITGMLLGAGQILYIFKVGTHASKIRIQTAAGAWVDLETFGAAQRGANSDITSLSGLTTPLSQSQGGTGKSSIGAAAVGPVSQLAGIANGAVVEYTPASADPTKFGDCIRFADGTQICTYRDTSGSANFATAYGSLFNSSVTYGGFAFQKPFKTGTVPTVMQPSTKLGTGFAIAWGVNVESTATNWPAFFLFSAMNVSTSLAYSMVAIGRWY